MLSLVLAVSLAQAPLGVGGVQTSQMPNFPPSNYVQHLFADLTKGCVQWSFNGTGWRCLLADGDTATKSNGVRALASAPVSSATGDTYFDSTKGCLQTWTGSAWSPSSCPITTAPTVPAPPNTLLNPAPSPPATSTTGATYYDTAQGCLRTWNGTAFSTCATQPQPPNTLLSPSSTAPSTTTVGAGYFDTALGCLRVWNGSAFTTCNTAAAGGTAMAQSNGPPTLTGSAASNKGKVYFDTTLGCVRNTADGITFGECLTIEKCVTTTVTGLSIPLTGVSTTSTLTLAGAISGRPCRPAYPSFMPLNASAVCRVSAANTLEYRFQSNSGLLSSVIAVPNGTYTFCTEVLW